MPYACTGLCDRRPISGVSGLFKKQNDGLASEAGMNASLKRRTDRFDGPLSRYCPLFSFGRS